MGLSEITDALDLLGRAADQIIPVFLSVDYERDTPDVLAGYIKYFHERFVGLTGTPEQIAAAAESFDITYYKVQTQYDDSYLINHSAVTYLLDPEGWAIAAFPHGTTAQDMATEVRTIID